MTRRTFSHACHTFYKQLQRTLDAWLDDNAPRMGAALAFYTIFSLAPSLIIAIGAVGLLFGRTYAEAQIALQMNRLIGKDSTQAIMTLIDSTQGSVPSLRVALFNMVTLIVASTSALVEMKSGLNYVWRIRTPSGLESFVRRRFMSLSFVGGLTFMLIAALAGTLLLSVMGIHLQSAHLNLFQRFVAELFSFGVMILFFATVYKMLPDRSLHWRDLWAGSTLAAFLFTLSKTVIGFYIVKTAVASEYGTAGSFVAVLLWVYCSALILYFGAEFIKIRGADRLSFERPS